MSGFISDPGVIRKHLLPLSNNLLDIGSASKTIRTLYVGTSILHTSAAFLISANTSPGADTNLVSLNGGGGEGDSTRGAFVRASGNQNANPGFLQLFSGTGGAGIDVVSNGIGTIRFRTTSTPLTRWTILNNGELVSDATNGADLIFNRAGAGIKIKEGSNARMGVATLVGGTVTVANTSVTANTRIIPVRTTTGGTVGHLSTTQIASTSFTINSSSALDTSTVTWILFEPA